MRPNQIDAAEKSSPLGGKPPAEKILSMEFGNPMEKTPPAETNIQSFIIKIWLGEAKTVTGRPTWRGYITHVPSGRRNYLKKLADVIEFMTPYVYPRPLSRRAKLATQDDVLPAQVFARRLWTNRLKQTKKLRRVHFPTGGGKHQGNH